MKVLLFIDSEAKARTLAAQSGLEVEEAVLRESPLVTRHDSAMKNLHMGESGFHFSPRPSSDNTFLKQLEKNLDQEVIFAFDNDQRGDYWSWMVNGYLSSNGRQDRVCKVLRLEGLRRDLISAALNDADAIPFADGAAYYIRTLFNGYLVRHLQRLLGTASGPAKLPLDYISLTVLFLLIGRHNMTAPVVARAGLQFQVKLSDGSGQFVVSIKEGPGVVAGGLLADAAQVKNISGELAGQTFVLEEIRRRSAAVRHAEPLNLSNILHEGKRLFAMSPGDVWGSLVKLYHGVELDGVWTGLISDPYGNVNKGSGEIVDQIRIFLNDTYGENEVKARDCNPKAIWPLQPNVTGDALRGEVTEKTAQLYELIRSRAMMSQMAAPQGDEVEVDVRAGDFVFTCQGIRMEKPGCFQENSQNEYDMLQPLSSQLQEGQSLELVEMAPRTAANPSANLYTLPALLEELQDFSIVHSSTLPAILQKMIEGEYVRVLSDGTLLCLENVKKVVDAVNRVFPKMQGLNLSAYFEQTVTEVISGRKDIDFALKQFNQNFQMQGVALLKKTAPSPVIPRGKRSKNIIKSPIEEETGKPESPVITQHEGKKSESSENEIFDSEAARFQEGQDETAITETVDDAGEETPQLDVVEEKAVEQDVVESVVDSDAVDEELEDLPVVAAEEESEPEIPEQEIIEEEREEEPLEIQPHVSSDDVVEEKVQALSEALEHEDKESSGSPEGREDIQCPLCGNDYLLVKQTSSDKIYYECSVSNCEFIAWARPHGVFCPQCKSPYLVEKKGADGKMLKCPKAGCRYEQPLNNGDSGTLAGKKKKVLVKRKKGSSGSGAKKRKVVVRRRR
jgi:DNA topoisomerase IA/ssDNA-binding Zn-finger/Zn-ribbon topoisomerase 1